MANTNTNMRNETDESIAAEVIEAAFAVHRGLGPGLLENIYENCLKFELEAKQFDVRQQVTMPVIYKGNKLETGYRLDLFVNTRVIIEVKAVQDLLPIHQAQLITYLKLAGCHIGLLLNFNAVLLKHGIRRIVV